MNPNAQPAIKTQRLLLRPFKLTDAADVQRLAGTQEVAATTQYIPYPYPDGYAEAWINTHKPNYIRGYQVIYAITLQETGELMGCIGLDFHKEHESATMGYWMGPQYWNQGYCTEAVKGLIAFGFKVLKLNRIQAKHLPRNPASGRVLLKAGMTHEGTERKSTKVRGTFEDMEAYSILRTDLSY